MALGKAFIEVHADTKPFARELGLELNRILNAAERNVRASSTKLGETIAKETGKGVEKNKKQIGQGIDKALTGTLGQGAFSRFAKGIVDSIDDGLSGLPAELKVVLGASLAALAPVAVALGSAIAAAVVSGLTIGGLSVVGVLLASQFEEVQTAAESTFRQLRTQFLEGSRFLVRPFLNAINLIQDRFGALQPILATTFERAASVIVPVVDAIIGAFEQFLPGFNAGLRDIGDFLAPLQIGFRLIGKAVGQFFDEVLNHPDAPAALYDLLIAVEDLIQAFTILVSWGLDTYSTFRAIAEALGLVAPYEQDIEKFAEQFGIAGEEATIMGRAIEGTVAPTEEEARAVKDLNTALGKLIDLQFDIIGDQIAFQQGLDDLTESVRENGRTLDINSQAGRNNANQLLELAQIAVGTRQRNLELGVSAEEAAVQFNAQRDAIYATGRQAGLSKPQIDGLVGALLGIPAPQDTGITSAALKRVQQALAAIQLLRALLKAFDFGGGRSSSVPAYAAGGIVTSPTNALIGEAGPEAIIPLSNPARAAQVMNEAGLSGMVSPTVNVYIGNQQIDAYIDVRVNQAMATTARSLSYGSRGI